MPAKAAQRDPEIAAAASAENPNQNRMDAMNPTNGPNASSTYPSKSGAFAFVLPCLRGLVSPCPSEAGRAE